MAKWETMWDCFDNQDVGLEAAIIKRVRNSSLVKWSGADNVTGLKHSTEVLSFTHYPGRKIQECGWVGERCVAGEAAGEPSRGSYTSENVDMSSERSVRNISAERPRVPGPG